MAEKLPVTQVGPYFKTLLAIVVAIQLTTPLGMGLLAFFGPPELTESQRQFAAMCDTGFKRTLGAVVGLLGGRASKPDRVEG